MREKNIKFQKETGNHHNIEATPAEGTSFRLAQKDKTRFKDIKAANERN
jgi:ribonucleoside-triphosphate reductase